MVQKETPDAKQLQSEYFEAKNRLDSYAASMSDHKEAEQKARREELEMIALDALARLYEAGGTTRLTEKPVSQWVRDAQVMAEVAREMDPDASEHYEQMALYRETVEELEYPSATDDKMV